MFGAFAELAAELSDLTTNGVKPLLESVSKSVRTVAGILHGFYVYVPVQRYWLQVAQSADTDSVTQDLSVDLVLRSEMKLDIAIEQLERHGRFTDFGKAVVRELRASANELHSEIDRLGLPDDAPAHYCEPDGTIRPECHQDGTRITVRELIQDHIERFKPLENVTHVSAV